MNPDNTPSDPMAHLRAWVADYRASLTPFELFVWDDIARATADRMSALLVTGLEKP